MFCSSCGKSIPDYSRFCPECGFSLAGSQAGAKPPSPAPAAPLAAVAAPPPPLTAFGAVPPQPSTIGTRDQHGRVNLIYPKNPPISPHLAWVSLIIVGLPQLVHGQVGKGIVLFLLFWLSVPTGIGPLIVLLLALVDAYMVGSALKSGKAIGKWQFFPS